MSICKCVVIGLLGYVSSCFVSCSDVIGYKFGSVGLYE